MSNLEQEIQEASSLDELIRVVLNSHGLQGSEIFYTPEDLRKRIEQVRSGHRHIGFITRTAGLRDRVEQLLPQDPKYLKRVKGVKIVY